MKILVLIKFHNFCHFFKFQEKSVDQEPSIFQYWHLLTWNFRGHLFRTVHHVKLDFRVEVGPSEWFVYFMMYFKPLLPRKHKTLKNRKHREFSEESCTSWEAAMQVHTDSLWLVWLVTSLRLFISSSSLISSSCLCDTKLAGSCSPCSRDDTRLYKIYIM